MIIRTLRSTCAEQVALRALAQYVRGAIDQATLRRIMRLLRHCHAVHL